jgi:putative acetyltransferase
MGGDHGLRIGIRAEREADYSTIREINNAAFGRKGEGRLVDKLRMTSRFNAHLSLLAEADGRVVGHVLFYQVDMETELGVKGMLSLAPIAVLPSFQKRGVGSTLIREGLDRALKLGYDAVIVMGHAGYYPRFGFRPASAWGIRPNFKVPDEAFMALELVEGALQNCEGAFRYPKEFEGL